MIRYAIPRRFVTCDWRSGILVIGSHSVMGWPCIISFSCALTCSGVTLSYKICCWTDPVSGGYRPNRKLLQVPAWLQLKDCWVWLLRPQTWEQSCVFNSLVEKQIELKQLWVVGSLVNATGCGCDLLIYTFSLQINRYLCELHWGSCSIHNSHVELKIIANTFHISYSLKKNPDHVPVEVKVNNAAIFKQVNVLVLVIINWDLSLTQLLQ